MTEENRRFFEGSKANVPGKSRFSGLLLYLNGLIWFDQIWQNESDSGGIFEGDFGTLRHRIFRWRVWHNLIKSEQLNTILMQALSNK